MAIIHGTDTFLLNQSGFVAGTETFENGTDAISVHSVQDPKHIFPQPKHWGCDNFCDYSLYNMVIFGIKVTVMVFSIT